jgi:hypothetical protein
MDGNPSLHALSNKLWMYKMGGLYEEGLGYMMGCCKKGITTLYLRLGRFVTFMSGIS